MLTQTKYIMTTEKSFLHQVIEGTIDQLRGKNIVSKHEQVFPFTQRRTMQSVSLSETNSHSIS
jgi:hypothetical protein